MEGGGGGDIGAKKYNTALGMGCIFFFVKSYKEREILINQKIWRPTSIHRDMGE